MNINNEVNAKRMGSPVVSSLYHDRFDWPGRKNPRTETRGSMSSVTSVALSTSRWIGSFAIEVANNSDPPLKLLDCFTLEMDRDPPARALNQQ